MRIARDLDIAYFSAAVVEEIRMGGQGLEDLPDEMPDMPNLRVVDLGNNRLKSVPAWVWKNKNIRELVFKGNDIDYLTTAISRLTQLRRLVLDGNPITGLPKLPPSIQEVFLNGCKISAFPEALLECPSIQVIEMASCGLRYCRVTHSLPMALHTLDLSRNELMAFPWKLVETAGIERIVLDQNPFLEDLDEGVGAKQIAAFFRDSVRSKMTFEDRNIQLAVLLNLQRELDDLEPDRLLGVLKSPFGLVRDRATEVLPKVLENPFLEAVPRRVCFSGKFPSLRLSEVEEELTKAGSLIVQRITGPKDCLIVGSGLQLRLLEDAMRVGAQVGFEKHVAGWISRSKGRALVLAAEDNGMVANLVRLLRSQEPGNIEIALQIMQGLGVPPSVKGILLALRLFHPDTSTRKKVELLWLETASAPLRKAVSKAWQESEMDQDVYNHSHLLDALSDRHDVDLALLLDFTLDKGRVGLNFVSRLKPAEQEYLYRKVATQGGLRLTYLELDKVPEGVLKLKEITNLDLSSNQLTELPSGISEMTRLQALDVSNNSITSLPESLFELHNLVSLDLSRNRIDSLPDKWAQLHGLVALRISENPLKRLPPSFASLPNLEYLGLKGVRMDAIGEHVGKLAALRELDLAETWMRQVPEWIQGLALLEGLLLTGNNLTELPDWLGGMPNLRHLDISYQPMTTLPEGLTTAKRLERIYLLQKDGMNWQQVAEVLARIPSLKFVYFKRDTLVGSMEQHLERTIRQAKVEFVY